MINIHFNLFLYLELHIKLITIYYFTLTMSITFKPQNTKAAATKRIIRYEVRKKMKILFPI